MKSQPNKRRTESHPKDKSLEAYKAWILEIAKRLIEEGSKIEMTEEAWRANGKEYWKEKSGKRF